MAGSQLIRETLVNPVFGNTFEANPARLELVGQHLGAVTKIAQPRLTDIVQQGMPEWSPQEVSRVVDEEIMHKLKAFYSFLSWGELGDSIDLLAAGTVAVGGMYWGDQTNDRGDRHTTRALKALGLHPQPKLRGKAGHRLAALNQIETNIRSGGDERGIAPEEDIPYILACFLDQVLVGEGYMQDVSRKFLKLGDQKKFLAKNGAHIADVTTVTAGFPSVSSSLYGIYRHGDSALPPLAEIYSNIQMKDLLQACNVVVRIWDELGDWYMDTGAVPEKGVFVINPLNEYDPSMVERYCELAFIKDPGEIALLKEAFKNFHRSDNERPLHSAYILETFRAHIEKYVNTLGDRLPPQLAKRYAPYVTLCKRVLEIGYVNRKGDIDMAASAEEIEI